MNRYQNYFGPPSPHNHHGNSSRGGGAGGGAGNNHAMSEIVIAHDTNHSLTTSYYNAQDETTPEQRRQRQRTLAMAKAEAVTNRYSHLLPTTTTTNNSNTTQSNSQERRTNWVAQQQQQQPTRRTSAEPGGLALSDSFRAKSSDDLGSTTSSGDHQNNNNNMNNGSGHSSDNNSPIPPPPPLKTEVTEELLTPKLQRQDQDYFQQIQSLPYSPEDRKMPAKKQPPPQQQQQPYRRSSVQLPSQQQQQQQQTRRVSDSFAMTGASSDYRNRASFQANENRYSSNQVPTLPPRKPAPPIYPDLAAQSGTRLVAAMALEEQARLMSQLQLKRQQETSSKTNYRAMTPPLHETTENNNNNNSNNLKTFAILEQEKLWNELSGSHQSIGTAATAASSIASSPSPPSIRRLVISPQEEQARLWEQIQLQKQQHSQASFSLGGSHSSQWLNGSSASLNGGSGARIAAISPIDEQVRLLEAIQQQQQQQYQRRMPSTGTYDTTSTVAPNSFLSTVEAQERMLRALASSTDRSSIPPPLAPPAVIDPLEEQAKRLREIQEEKDKQIVEMACKLSFAEEPPPPVTAEAAADDEVTLEVVMELSRQEAAEAQAKADLADQQALQVALSQSRGELGPVDARVVEDSSSVSPKPQQGEETAATTEAASDLELRRSIAELACQSSDRTLGETSDQPATNLSFPTPRNRNKSRRRTWSLGFRHRS